jgi:hypothetical protein
MCQVDRLAYDFGTRAGAIYFPDGDCCDMGGCLALFRAIDPGVRLIQTYSGPRTDIRYVKDGHHDWRAYDTRHTAPEPGGAALRGDP